MIDKESVMAGLECCSDSRAKCLECPYIKLGRKCMELLIVDAMELAKEQDRLIKRLRRENMKSRYSIPPQYKEQVEKEIRDKYRDEIIAEVNEYVKKKSVEIGKRFLYASIVTLYDLYGSRFGKKQETLNHHFQRFSDYMQNIILDAVKESYEWSGSTELEAASKALKKECEDRGIEVSFD